MLNHLASRYNNNQMANMVIGRLSLDIVEVKIGYSQYPTYFSF